MPEMDGGELALLIKSCHPELPVILHSGSVSIPQNAHYWVDAMCSKTAPREELLAKIEELVAQRAGCVNAASLPPSTAVYRPSPPAPPRAMKSESGAVVGLGILSTVIQENAVGSGSKLLW